MTKPPNPDFPHLKDREMKNLQCVECKRGYWVYKSAHEDGGKSPCCACRFEDKIDAEHVETFQTHHMLRGIGK